MASATINSIKVKPKRLDTYRIEASFTASTREGHHKEDSLLPSLVPTQSAEWSGFDYGGREVDDVYVGMKFMLERYKWLDPKRVGIVGWSHGGMITLLNIFAHPHDYAVAYAGVPVSDVISRLGYESEGYRSQFSAPYAIGETVNEDIQEYRKRSPVTHAKELDTPLLIHTNTNDEDVNYLEVEHLIQALTFEKKVFDYKVYQNAPGGHYFNRMDTSLALESRHDIYVFLAKYLHPDNSMPADFPMKAVQ